MKIVSNNSREELAGLIEKLLAKNRIRKVYCAEGKTMMPPDANFSARDRLALPINGCHRMTIFSKGKVSEISPVRGEATFIPEGSWNKPDWILPVTVATFCFAPNETDISYVKCPGGKFKERDKVSISIGKFHPDGIQALSLMRNIFRANPADRRGLSAVEIILYYCLENLKNSDEKYGKSQSLWISIRNYLDECFSSNISRDDLASLFGISSNYLSNLFQRQSGKTFIEYINATRIKYACMLLESTNSTLDEIALSSGFNETSYFCRVFKNKTGMQPTLYRSKARFKNSSKNSR